MKAFLPLKTILRTSACFWIGLLTLVHPTDSRSQWAHFNNRSDIRALYQQGDTLWIGTNGGCLLYNILSQQIVGEITAGRSLPGNSVRAISGRGGTVWVGTDDGLAELRRGESRLYTPATNRVFADIRSIDVGRSGRIYIGTFGQGLGIIEAGKTRRLTRADSLLDNKVFAVAEMNADTVYYATSLGLCAYRDSVWVSFQAGAGLPRGEVRALIPVSDTDVYALVWGRGLFRFDGKRAERLRTDGAFPEEEIGAIAVDRKGALWAAGRFGGIARYSYGRWTSVGAADESIANARWRSACGGASGGVYFGSSEGLIAAVDESGLRKIQIPSALPEGHVGVMAEGGGRKYFGNGPFLLSTSKEVDGFVVEGRLGSVFAFAVDPWGGVWASGRWGLIRQDAGRWVEVVPDLGSDVPLILSLAFDTAGNLWVGTQNGRVYRYDGQLWIPMSDAGDFRGASVDEIVVDGRRAVWAFSHEGGAYRFDGRRWESQGESQFGSSPIRDAVTDPVGHPVVATDAGLWRYGSDGAWRLLEVPGPDRIGPYRSISFDASGRLYLGTARGLAIVTGGGFRWIDEQNGLQGREITDILLDGDGYLWVGFRRDGMSRILLENLW